MLTATQQHFEFVDVETMNQVLKECKGKIKYYGEYNELIKNNSNITLYGSAFILDKKVKFELLTRYKGTITRFICYKDGRDNIEGAVGSQIFTNFSKYWKTPRYNIPQEDENGEPLCNYDRVSATPALDYNAEYEGQRIQAWGYDLNSAYSATMLKGWIDTSKPPRAKIINPETEVGFRYDDDNDRWELQHRGYSLHVFEKCETPAEVRRYIVKWYSLKKNAAAAGDKKLKLQAKQHLNFVVGYWQRVNPWLRAYVVCSCNEFIESLIDENTLLWNTDSIVSRVRRYDLEQDLGAGIGQWKLEHEGVVAYLGCEYQWNKELPTYRGQPKTWFPEDWDILRDPVPIYGNLYYYDKDENLLKEINYALGE